jgi:hypothetical protein
MQLQSLSHVPTEGFSSRLPAELDSDRTLVLAFCAPEYEGGDALEALVAAFPSSVVAGCSTAGEILGTRVADGSMSVAVARFASTTLAHASAPLECPEGSEQAARTVAAALVRDDLRGVLVLADGLSANGSAVVRAFSEVLPPGVFVSGGLAGDGRRFERTWVLDRGVPRGQRLVAVGLYGDACRLAYGSRSGWDVFGPHRLVTRSDGNLLYELDEKPALELYRTYLGDRAIGLPATGLLFPLSLQADLPVGERVIRTITGLDEERGAIRFAGEIPQGKYVQLMHANADRLVQGASQAGYRALGGQADADPVLVLAISSAGRRMVLGERAEEEVEATVAGQPAHATQVGFYAYGEVSPSSHGGCDLHTQTITLTTISEVA